MSQVIEDIFGSGGALSKELENYRPRPGQIALANQVQQSIQDKRHLLAEGVTGTGKSLAYGVPAALWSLKSGGRAVITTANIALQEQLIKKDLPLIARIMKYQYPDFKFSIMKGAGNYLCPLRLKAAVDEADRSGHVPEWLDEIYSWYKSTETGDKSELSKEYAISEWGEVCCDSSECFGGKCPKREKGECFLHRARSLVKQSHVIVTNYHLLYSHLNLAKQDLLPSFSVLVLDEAHEAAKIAMDFMGFKLTRGMLLWAAKKLLKVKDAEASRLREEMIPLISLLFENVKAIHNSGVSIIENPIEADIGEKLASCFDRAARFLIKESAGLSGMAQLKMAAYCRKCKEHRDYITSVCCPESAEFPPESVVYYLSKDSNGEVSVCSKMVEVSEYMKDVVFKNKTVISTSATLSTNNNFNFVASQFGLSSREYSSMITPTPFDPGRVLRIVPEDPFPAPNRPEWVKEVSKALESTVKSIGGRTMALFTSYKNMRAVRGNLKGNLPDFELLVQGEIPRMRIIELFKSSKDRGKKSVILATASFWQGVDIPGEALSCLFIDKLPFKPPTDPVLYYLENYTNASPFFDYSIPHAIIALKQGIGRLIRTEEDYGAVVVCDVRINSKNYGKQFLTAFPDNCFETPDFKDIGSFLKRFGKDERKEGA